MASLQDIKIEIPYEAIEAFCRKWGITEFGLFGSVLRDDFRPDSDIDVLARFGPTTRLGWTELLAMEDELAAIFGRKVDLVSWKGVEESRNPYRRNEILGTVRRLYAA